MQNSLSPFGIRYQGNVVIVKLRIHPFKFFKVELAKYGSYRTTGNGYIIFETALDRESSEMAQVNYCIDAMRAIELPKPNKPAE
jgi:hypothetical protein